LINHEKIFNMEAALLDNDLNVRFKKMNMSVGFFSHHNTRFEANNHNERTQQ